MLRLWAMVVLVGAVLASLLASVQAETLREKLRERAAERPRTVPSIPSDILVKRNVAYGEDVSQKLDVYAPPHASAAPIILMVHGGGWRRGDKAMPGVVNNKVAYWGARGYIIVSVNYRLVPKVNPVEEAGDVAQALAFVQSHAVAWGGDPAKIVLMGHSAGAHLVTLLTAAPSIAEQAHAKPWLGTVVLDSAAYDVTNIMDTRHFSLYDTAFGTDQKLWRDASPLLRLTQKPLPMLLVCSSRRRDSLAQAKEFAAKATKLGGDVKVLPEDLAHGEIDELLGEPGVYTAQVEKFMQSLGLK